MGLASTASSPGGGGGRERRPAVVVARSSAATGSLSSKASTQALAVLGLELLQQGRRRSEVARLRRTWSRSTSIRAVPSTANRASAVATRSSASSTVTGDVRRSASWSRAWRNPAAETAMSVGGDALVGAAPDDPGRPGRGPPGPRPAPRTPPAGPWPGPPGPRRGCPARRPATRPGVDLLGAGLSGSGMAGSSGWRLWSPDSLASSASTRSAGAPKWSRAPPKATAQTTNQPKPRAAPPITSVSQWTPSSTREAATATVIGRPGGQPGLGPERPAAAGPGRPPPRWRPRRRCARGEREAAGGARWGTGGRSRSTSALTVLAIRFWPTTTVTMKASTARRRRRSHSSPRGRR